MFRRRRLHYAFFSFKFHHVTKRETGRVFFGFIVLCAEFRVARCECSFVIFICIIAEHFKCFPYFMSQNRRLYFLIFSSPFEKRTQVGTKDSQAAPFGKVLLGWNCDLNLICSSLPRHRVSSHQHCCSNASSLPFWCSSAPRCIPWLMQEWWGVSAFPWSTVSCHKRRSDSTFILCSRLGAWHAAWNHFASICTRVDTGHGGGLFRRVFATITRTKNVEIRRLKMCMWIQITLSSGMSAFKGSPCR